MLAKGDVVTHCAICGGNVRVTERPWGQFGWLFSHHRENYPGGHTSYIATGTARTPTEIADALTQGIAHQHGIMFSVSAVVPDGEVWFTTDYERWHKIEGLG